MKVKQLFSEAKVSLQFINDKFEGKYWFSCYLFIKDNWEKDLDDLSKKQIEWAKRICDDAEEKRIELKIVNT